MTVTIRNAEHLVPVMPGFDEELPTGYLPALTGDFLLSAASPVRLAGQGVPLPIQLLVRSLAIGTPITAIPIILIGILDKSAVTCHPLVMASYFGTRRRHVDFLKVVSSGCRAR